MATAEEQQASLLQNRKHVAAIFEAARDGRAKDLREHVEAYAASDLSSSRATPRSVLAETRDANDRGALHFAAKSGHVAACVYIASTDPTSIGAADGNGRTPAMLAAGGGYVDALKLFFAAEGCDPCPEELSLVASPSLRADANAAAPDGTCALTSAALGGHAAAIVYLLARGARLDVVANGVSPVLGACFSGSPDAVQALLDAGAEIASANDEGITPLHAASVRGEASIVALLLAHGADALAEAKKPGDAGVGITPLAIAAEALNASCVDAFLRCEALPPAAFDARSGEDMNPAELAAYSCSEQGINAEALARGRTVVRAILVASAAEAAADAAVDSAVLALIARMSQRRSELEGAAGFIAAPSFRGAKEGFVFMTSTEGLGYYRDSATGGVIAPPTAASVAAKGACDVARNRGNVLFKAGDKEGALAAYSEALTHDPMSKESLSNRSMCRLGLGDNAGALADALKCKAVAPKWVRLRDVFFFRSLCLFSLLSPPISHVVCRMLPARAHSFPMKTLRFRLHSHSVYGAGDADKPLPCYNYRGNNTHTHTHTRTCSTQMVLAPPSVPQRPPFLVSCSAHLSPSLSLLPRSQPKASWRCAKAYLALENYEDAAVNFWEGYNYGGQKSKEVLKAFKDAVARGRAKMGLPPNRKIGLPSDAVKSAVKVKV